MKLGRILIGITVTLLGCFSLTVYAIESMERTRIPVEQMNDIVKQMEEVGVKNHSMVKEFRQNKETNLQYEVVFASDSNYERMLFDSYKNQSILMDLTKEGKIIGKLIFPIGNQREETLRQEMLVYCSIVFGVVLIFVWTIGGFLYVQFVKPFHKLKAFATYVAAGQLDLPLAMPKKNYFGAFTESFDIMREELRLARIGEYEANRSKKELVASLSHDIKTPVSTIKAYCEILAIQCEDKNIREKITIIHNKTEVINELVNNLFHATLEELEELKITKQEVLSTEIKGIFEDLNYYGKIVMENEVPDCLLSMDRLRFHQVVGNIISNSYKYADTEILVSFSLEDGYLKIKVQDKGTSMGEEEIERLCEKFYRGKNATSQSGSGLGLYLANQFMSGMGGAMELYLEHGFVVDLYLRIR